MWLLPVELIDFSNICWVSSGAWYCARNYGGKPQLWFSILSLKSLWASLAHKMLTNQITIWSDVWLKRQWMVVTIPIRLRMCKGGRKVSCVFGGDGTCCALMINVSCIVGQDREGTMKLLRSSPFPHSLPLPVNTGKNVYLHCLGFFCVHTFIKRAGIFTTLSFLNQSIMTSWILG